MNNEKAILNCRRLEAIDRFEDRCTLRKCDIYSWTRPQAFKLEYTCYNAYLKDYKVHVLGVPH